MKKIILLFTILFFVKVSNSQVVFEIISSSCSVNIIGSYTFTLSDTSNDWNTPDMNDPANAVQGCLVLVNDGNSGVTGAGTPPLNVPNYTLGCLNSSQDLSGKIAVMYRGACTFAHKALNAQLRGAIGVIIINHTGQAEEMLGTIEGLNVNIPVVQVSRNDGDALVACIDTICNGVVGFIGARLSTDISNNNVLEEINPYPNPTTNLLTIPIRQKVEGKVLVEAFDLAGKLVLSENKTIGNEALKLNVSSISNGTYLFKLSFANGTFDQFKVSVNR